MTPIEIEQLIVARLAAALKDGPDPLVKHVYDTSSYGAVEEESQLVPSVAVIYNGYAPGDEAGQGAAQAVELEYLVVICTRSSNQTLRASGAKAAASVVFDAVLPLLLGWKPGQGASRLRLAPAPGAGYSDAGFTYLPIAFTCRITYQPTPN